MRKGRPEVHTSAQYDRHLSPMSQARELNHSTATTVTQVALAAPAQHQTFSSRMIPAKRSRSVVVFWCSEVKSRTSEILTPIRSSIRITRVSSLVPNFRHTILGLRLALTLGKRFAVAPTIVQPHGNTSLPFGQEIPIHFDQVEETAFRSAQQYTSVLTSATVDPGNVHLYWYILSLLTVLNSTPLNSRWWSFTAALAVSLPFHLEDDFFSSSTTNTSHAEDSQVGLQLLWQRWWSLVHRPVHTDCIPRRHLK